MEVYIKEEYRLLRWNLSFTEKLHQKLLKLVEILSFSFIIEFT